MRLADCHPTRKHYSKGLCRACYEEQLKFSNPEYAKRQMENKSQWNQDHPEDHKKYMLARKERERNNPVLLRQRRSQGLKRAYGITADDFDIMLEKQNNACAICFRKQGDKHLHVDHCHDTGKVRGLLCHQCNWYLGTIDADPTILERIKAYRK